MEERLLQAPGTSFVYKLSVRSVCIRVLFCWYFGESYEPGIQTQEAHPRQTGTTLLIALPLGAVICWFNLAGARAFARGEVWKYDIARCSAYLRSFDMP